jgi:glycine oxidase
MAGSMAGPSSGAGLACRVHRQPTSVVFAGEGRRVPTSINVMGVGNSSKVDLAIVGGGIVGLSVAWRASEQGMSVVVLERGELGGGATHAAAGMLAPVAEAEFGEAGRKVLELGMRSALMWPRFAARLERASGIDVGLRQSGTLVVARDDDEARELERQLAFRRSLGLRAVRLRASEARAHEPALAPTVRLALHAPEDHSIDPRNVVAALRSACEQRGVELREHTPVLGLELDAQGRRVVGVRVGEGNGEGEGKGNCEGDGDGDGNGNGNGNGEGDGEGEGNGDGNGKGEGHGKGGDVASAEQREGNGGTKRDFFGEEGSFELVDAGAVVVAAGAWSGGLAGLPAGARVPVRPVKGQIMRLRDPAGPGLLTGVVRFAGGYLVPRGDGRYVLGATMEERGFEPDATAGGVYELLRDAHELVPGVGELHIEELGVGYRPSTPDNAPVVGAGALRGLTWASGHHRNGILLAPITAELALASLEGKCHEGHRDARGHAEERRDEEEREEPGDNEDECDESRFGALGGGGKGALSESDGIVGALEELLGVCDPRRFAASPFPLRNDPVHLR